MEATFTNPNYDTVVKTYGFVVKKADFDEAYVLNRNYIDLGETDVGSSVSIKDADEYFKMMVVDRA